VSSSLAEVTEILDRHIDNDDDDANISDIDDKNLKRKRISFNVPGIELTTAENENDDEDDDDDRSKNYEK
jgi:hypothetical protein